MVIMRNEFFLYLEELESFFIERNNNHFILRNFILNSMNKQKEQLNKQLKEYTEDELADDESHFSSLLIDFNIYYPNNIEYLSITQLYTNFELSLSSLCMSINQFMDAKLSYKDFKGNNTIDSYRKYLIYCCDFDLKELIKWDELDEFRQLRNLIAHSNGIYDKKDSRLGKIIAENPQLELDEKTNQVFVKSMYALNITNILNDAIKAILNAVRLNLPDPK